jgi:hypothetical protein
MSDKAVGSGQDHRGRRWRKRCSTPWQPTSFYIFSHPKALGNVQSRMESIVRIENPADPFGERPEIGVELKAALRAA